MFSVVSMSEFNKSFIQYEALLNQEQRDVSENKLHFFLYKNQYLVKRWVGVQVWHGSTASCEEQVQTDLDAEIYQQQHRRGISYEDVFEEW